MKEKYLPIGSVCTVKGNTNKIMIIGYLPMDYNGNLNLYDYSGCIYPNGLFSSSSNIAFNHQDIEKVDFMGYESDLYKNLNTNLLSASVIELAKEKATTNSKPKYVFDKNGVIIMDNTVVEPEKKVESKPLSNPFEMNYETKEVNASNERFKFDENGVIIEDLTVSKPVETKSKYKFDENGIIIEDNTVKA